MEIICLDTGILIDFYRRKDKQNAKLFELSKQYEFAIPSIVKYEILRGDKKKDKFWLQFFNKCQILSFDDKCSELAADIYKKLKEQNKLIGTDDILIAAIAIRNNCKLATLNVKDFERIENIRLLSN